MGFSVSGLVCCVSSSAVVNLTFFPLVVSLGGMFFCVEVLLVCRRLCWSSFFMGICQYLLSKSITEKILAPWSLVSAPTMLGMG